MKKTLLSAHRGGPEDSYIPNSLEATNAVKSVSVDLIEFDVRVTKDNKFVTLHDDYIMVNGVSTLVENLNANTIIQHAEGACYLEEMLRSLNHHAIAHVDIKDTRMEIEIVDLCKSIVGVHGFIITTLEDESVLKIRKARPNVQVALTLGRDTRGMNKLKEFQIRLSEFFPARRVTQCHPTILAINYREVWFGTLWWAARKDIPVLLWTMDTPKQIEQAWNNSYIWAFTTNYPRRALRLKPRSKTGFAKTPLHLHQPRPYHLSSS